METEHTAQEISRLRRCINDLASLLALPAIGSGQDTSRVISSLFAVLVRMLDLDFAYARITDPANESPREWVQSKDNFDLRLEANEIGRALQPYLAAKLPAANFHIPNPLEEGTASIALFQLEIQNRVGLFVAASRRPEFPTETERLLLHVATNQAAVALREAPRMEQREAKVEIEPTHTEAALQHSEERFRQTPDSIPETIRLIIDSTPALIHTALPDGYIDFFNRTWLQYVGLPLENIQGWNWATAIHPDDVEGILKKWRASLASGEPFLHEARVRRADGEYRWMLHHTKKWGQRTFSIANTFLDILLILSVVLLCLTKMTPVWIILLLARGVTPKMMMGDLLTITQYNLPIKILVFDNSALGMVKLEMEVLGMPDYQTDLKNPNFAKLAEAIGMMSVRIENPADVSSGLKKALQHSGPALIDVVTDPNAVSLPSHITAEQVEGFALTMGKLVLSGHIDEVVDTIETNIRHI